jgi:peptidoglycan/xylan/chitin deacetylase (PgdA/CDA1 family)
MLISFDDNYASTYTLARPLMKKLGIHGICYVVTDWIGKPDRMDLKQLLQLRDEGWEIGSHTITHPDLTKSDPENAFYEINESKSQLLRLGFDVKSFAYPYGHFNDYIYSLVKKTYDWARACYEYDMTDWAKPSYNLVNYQEDVRGYGLPLIHSIDMPEYRSNVSYKVFEKLCWDLVANAKH